MIRRSKFKAYLDDRDYADFRLASSRGKLNAVKEYTRDEKSGEVTVVTLAPKKMFEQLEQAINFGAITAPEVFVKA